METLKLTGETPRCWWCGKKIEGDPLNVQVTFSGKDYQMVVCSTPHAQEVQNAYVYIKKMLPVFFIGMLLGLVLLAAGRFQFAILGLLILGVTIWLCPFTTPQTTEMLGLQKAFRIGKIGGVILTLGALGLLVFQIIY